MIYAIVGHASCGSHLNVLPSQIIKYQAPSNGCRVVCVGVKGNFHSQWSGTACIPPGSSG
jgi:hypothetical protein